MRTGLTRYVLTGGRSQMHLGWLTSLLAAPPCRRHSAAECRAHRALEAFSHLQIAIPSVNMCISNGYHAGRVGSPQYVRITSS